jgi:hypothetical protein
LFEGITFKVAEGPERDKALRLVEQVYAEDIGHVPEDDFTQYAWYLIAETSSADVLAAFRIVGPECRPFDFEEYVDVSDIISRDRSAALIGRLCIHPDHRTVRSKFFLPVGLLKLAYKFARGRNITDFLMYTFPHLIPFYRGAFFRLLDPTFFHPGYKQQMHLMHLDLVDLETRVLPASARARSMFVEDRLPAR